MRIKALQLHAFLRKHERTAFLIWAALHLLPVLLPPFFMAYDGPTHLYNSRLLAEWFGPNRAWLEQFVFLQTEPLPNWITYPILTFFGELFNYFAADKILQVIYLLATLFGFRFFARAINPQAGLLSWLGGLLAFHHLTGMYNFSMSIPLLLWTCGYYYTLGGRFTPRSIAILLPLSLALYFSHLVGFLIGGFLCGSILIEQQWRQKQQSRFSWRGFSQQFGLTLLIFLPSLTMALLFLLKRSDGGAIYFSTAVLLDKLKHFDAFVIFNRGKEAGILSWLLLIFGIALYEAWKTRRVRSTLPLALWLGTLSLLLLYFTLPDAAVGASFTSIRLQILFFGCLFLIVATQRLAPLRELLSWLTLVGITLSLNTLYLRVWQSLSKDVAVWEAAASKLPNHSRVLSLNYSKHWYHEHISSFLGLDTPAIMMYDNYEAINDYFPFHFQPEVAKKYNLLRPLLAWPPTSPTAEILQFTRDEVDVIVRWRYDQNNPTQRDSLIDELLFIDFYPYYSSGPLGLELFMNKNRLYEY